MASYWAVIGDIVRSRALADRDAFQAQLERLLAEANRLGGPQLVAAWTVTAGDEFQALFRTADGIPTALERLCHGLGRPGGRFGLGYGTLSTALRRQAIGMDGPCFHAARAAITEARQQRRIVSVRIGPRSAQRAADVLNLALLVARERTGRQGHLVDLAEAATSQADLAARVGVTQGTISRELSRAHRQEVRAVLGHAASLLAEAAGAP